MASQINQTSNILGSMINQVNQAGQFQMGGGIGVDDDAIPANMLEATPVFELNYKSTKKQCIKKAKTELTKMVKEVVPTHLQNAVIIVDKIEQDAEQLGNLYYEYIKSDTMIQALMNIVGRGETQVKLFDTYSKMSKELRELTNLITTTQNNMRKYYIDTYLDIQTKDNADAVALPQSDNSMTMTTSGGSIMVGTENVVKLIEDKKRAALKAKYEEAK